MTQPAPAFGSTLAMCTNLNGEWDCDPTGRMATGRDVLSQRLINRQTTPLGSVIDSPNDCFDVSDWLSANMTDGQVAQLPGQIHTELLKDQEVQSLTVTVNYNPATSTLILTENIISGEKIKYSVMGIGLDTNIDSFPKELANIATSLKIELSREVDDKDLMEKIVGELKKQLETISQ